MDSPRVALFTYNLLHYFHRGYYEISGIQAEKAQKE